MMKVLGAERKALAKRVILTAILGLLVVTMLLAVAPIERAYAANGDVIGTPVIKDPGVVYSEMRANFYKAFNSYVWPTVLSITIAVFLIAGVKIGVGISKAEGEEKRAEEKKKLVHWIIGLVLALLAPMLVMGLSEIVMGFTSGVWA